MELNYGITALVLVIAIVIIMVMIKRNRKDRKDLEKKLDASARPPEEHKDVEPM